MLLLAVLIVLQRHKINCRLNISNKKAQHNITGWGQ